MSQRPSASRPASQSPPEGQRFVLPPVQLRDDFRQDGRQGEGSQSRPESRGPLQSQETSPRHGQTPQNPGSGENWRRARQSRDLGVHSILNPSEPEGSESSARRLSGTPVESPISAIGRSPFGASPVTTPSHTFPGQPLLQSIVPRRMLTPRSPSARVASAVRGPPGTIDAHQSPFLPSRGKAYMAEPGPSASSDIPTMPNAGQIQYQQHYGPPPASNPPIAPRRSSAGTMQAPGGTRHSQSTSPSISTSSNNPLSNQTSPASFLTHNSGVQPPPTHYASPKIGTAAQAGGMQIQGHSGPPRGQYTSTDLQIQGTSFHSSSAGSSRQTSASDPLQMMTFNTPEGSYDVPVDVHQASRSADEKRSRNAGASARFRKRRKEKEIQAHSSIERFEQERREMERRIREAEQEGDRYRQERDRLRDLVLRNPEMSHLAMQGPLSPRSLQSGPFSEMRQHQPQPQQLTPQPGFYGSEEPSDRAPRRRRTDAQGDFTSLPYPLPPASTLTPNQGPVYPGPPGPPPPTLPPLRMEQPTGPQTPGSNVTPSTSAAPQPPYDPYARGPYERGWAGDAGRR